MSDTAIQSRDERHSRRAFDMTRRLASGSIRNFAPPARTYDICKVFVAIGMAVFAVELFLAPQRVWGSVLMNSMYLLGLALGGLFLVASLYITAAAWGAVLRRIPEALVGLLPIAVLGIGLVLVSGSSLYPAFGEEGDHFIGFKALWLGRGFFLIRAFVYAALWLAFASAILGHSREQDNDGEQSHTRKNVALSAAFLVVFALTVWLSSVDWLMSLEPHWFSTIFGVYHFAGICTSSIAGVIIVVVWLRSQSVLRGIVTDDHIHDLGKLLFGFSIFWAYMWISQYLLIWYGNIPEETGYFVTRVSGMWGPLFVFNIVLNWLVPFIVLMPRGVKRSGDLMVKVAVVVLIGHWLDLYLQIFPGISASVPVFGIPEIGITLGAIGVAGIVVLRGLGRWPLVPLKDPYLDESLHFHQ